MITLKEETQERLARAAQIRGMDIDTYAEAVLQASIDADLRDFEDSCTTISRAYTQMESGLGMDFEEYAREQRAAIEARRLARESRL